MEIKSKRFGDLSTVELYYILKARAEVFVVEQNIVYPDPDEIDFVATHFFIEEDNKICAYLRLIDAGVKYDEMSVGRVLTLKPYRGRGHARRLMLRAMEVARQSGIGLRLEAQAYLTDFYRSLGFRPVSEEFILEGLPHVEMLLD